MVSVEPNGQTIIKLSGVLSAMVILRSYQITKLSAAPSPSASNIAAESMSGTGGGSRLIGCQLVVTAGEAAVTVNEPFSTRASPLTINFKRPFSNFSSSLSPALRKDNLCSVSTVIMSLHTWQISPVRESKAINQVG